MRVAIALAAAVIVASTSGALAKGKQIQFMDFFGSSTGCGMSITFSDLALPGDTPSLAAAKPTGTCARTGVAVGAIGVATVAGETGNWLTFGQNLNGKKNVTLLYVVQLNTRRKLFDGGRWATFETVDGTNVTFPNANLPQNTGTYTLGAP